MIDNHQIQVDLVTLLKGETTVTGLLKTTDEVREHQYMGKKYGVPAVRVHIASNTPHITRDRCDQSTANFMILCYAEEASSKVSQQLAKAVNDFLHEKDFAGTGYHAFIYSNGLGSPEVVGSEPALWRVTCGYFMNIYPTS